MKPIVIRLHGDAAKADRKKLEKIIRRMSMPVTEPIEFVVPGQDDGEVAVSKRGGVDGG